MANADVVSKIREQLVDIALTHMREKLNRNLTPTEAAAAAAAANCVSLEKVELAVKKENRESAGDEYGREDSESDWDPGGRYWGPGYGGKSRRRRKSKGRKTLKRKGAKKSHKRKHKKTGRKRHKSRKHRYHR